MGTMKRLAGTFVAMATITTASPVSAPDPADLLLINGRVYTLTWDEPDREGRPAPNAPHSPEGWHPDAQAVAIRRGRIVLVGSTAQALALKGGQTRVVDAGGATIIPGLVDAHV